MRDETTTQRLFQYYNTYSRRPTVRDPSKRKVIFKSLDRTVGAWLPSDRAARILDVACGEGALLSFLREKGYTNLAGFDISKENVNICHELGLAFVQRFDALRLNEFSGVACYDVIFALDILEHLPKELAASFMQQALARLSPGGSIIIQTPNMGSIFGCYHRYNDLSHDFGLTEKSMADLLLVAGFDFNGIEVKASWNATTHLGYLRELYLRLLHRLVFLAEDAHRPRIPTKNLLVRARRA